METLLGWITLLMAGGVSLLIVWGVRAGKHPIISARNFFLVGFIIYQLTSATIAFFTKQYWEVPVTHPESTGVLYVLWVSVFLAIFLGVYRLNWFTFGLPKLLAKPSPSPAPTTMVGLAIGFLLTGYALRLGFQQVPIIGVLASMTGVTLAIAGAGVAFWLWAKQVFNPVRAAFAGVMAIAATALAIFGSFGRRDLVSVAIVCLWGVYHSHFKKQNLQRMALPFAGVAVAGLLVIAAYTSVRSHENKNQGFIAQLTSLANADLKTGLIDIFAGQGAAPISMWLIESRPDSFEYDTLHTLRYAVLNIIPRDWWSEKMSSLGLDMVPQAGIANKGEGFTVGPGIIGHIANDNPYICLVLYPAMLGGFLRILDEMVKKEPDNLFVVIPVGVALGEIVAIPRGESGLFIFRTVLAVVAAYVGMRVVAKLLIALGMRYNVALTGEEGSAAESGYNDEFGPSLESASGSVFAESADAAIGAGDGDSSGQRVHGDQGRLETGRQGVPWGLQQS